MSDVIVQNMTFKVGQTMTITGVPTADSKRFSLNVGHSAQELALHVDVRFHHLTDKRTVVCNSYQGGSWREELREGGFPFNQGELFQVKITFTTGDFTIILADGYKINFPNRPRAQKYRYFDFRDDVRIWGIEVK